MQDFAYVVVRDAQVIKSLQDLFDDFFPGLLTIKLIQEGSSEYTIAMIKEKTFYEVNKKIRNINKENF